MRHTIEVQFHKNLTEGTSTFIAFVRAVMGRGFDKNTLGRWFTKLVDKEDYARKDRDAILTWLSSK